MSSAQFGRHDRCASFPIAMCSESQPQNAMALVSSLKSFQAEGEGLCLLVFLTALNTPSLQSQRHTYISMVIL